MRCLHCDKKLSLLKLAKGDSFCSPEHFDAYQLKISKSDIERLMGLPVGDTPKAPLIITPREDEPVAKIAPERIAPVPKQEAPQPEATQAPLPDAATRLRAMGIPPYAKFARPPLPSFAPENAPVVDEPVENPPDADVKFPVHEAAFSAAMLNLHLQLNYSDITPVDWNTPVRWGVDPEEFRTETKRPAMTLSPVGWDDDPADVPEVISEAVSKEAPEIIAEPEAPKAPARAAAPAPLIPSISALSFLLPRSFEERDVAVQPADFQISSLAAEPWPLEIPLVTADRQPEGWHISSGAIRLAPQALKIDHTPTLPFDTPEPPSHAVRLAVPVEPRAAAPCAVPGQPPLSFSRPPVAGGELSQPDLPEALPPSGRSMEIPLPGRPPRRFLQASSPATGALRTPPAGREPEFVNPPASSMEFGWRFVLPHSAIHPALLTATWNQRTNHAPLTVSAADTPQSPVPGSDSVAPVCPPHLAATASVLSPRGIAIEGVRGIERTPVNTILSSTFLEDSPLLPTPSATLPDAAAVTALDTRVSLASPAIQWHARRPAAPERTLARFLPVRKGPILPSAHSWPRLSGLSG